MSDEMVSGVEQALSDEPLHPIGMVARRTGLSLHTLRAWERRYGVVVPERTAGGQRLYSDVDIERLRLLQRATEAGRNISQVAPLDLQELHRLVSTDLPSPLPTPSAASGSDSDAAAWRRVALEAAERMDGPAVHAALVRAVVGLRPIEFLDDVMVPLLHEVGDRWHSGRIGPVHEHVTSVAARRVLSWLLDTYDAPISAPLLLSTTVTGEQHEFGAMMLSAVALEEGWRVAYLGSSLPADEIARAVRLLKPAAVGLSVVNRGMGAFDANVVDEAARLRDHLPAHVALLTGGAGAAVLRSGLEGAGARVITDLGGARGALGRRGVAS